MLKKLSSLFAVALFCVTASAQEPMALVWESTNTPSVVAPPSYAELYASMSKKITTNEEAIKANSVRLDLLEEKVDSAKGGLEGLQSYRPAPPATTMTDERVKMLAEKVFADKFASISAKASEAASNVVQPKKAVSSTVGRLHSVGDRWDYLGTWYEVQSVDGVLKWVQIAKPVYASPVPRSRPVTPLRNLFQNDRFIVLADGCTYDTVLKRKVSCPSSR